MEGTYYNDGTNRFFRAEAGDEEQHYYEIRMINNNQPDMLLRLHLTEEGTKNYYDYNVSGLQALSACNDEAVQREYLYTVIFSMEHLAELAETYLLNPADMVLSPDHIYLRRESGQIYFLYYPGQQGTLQEHIYELMSYFMKALKPEEESEVLLLYGLYQKAREKNIVLGTLAEYWRGNHGKEGRVREEKALPAELTEPGEDDDPVARELGLDIPSKGRAYAKWRQHRIIERETVPLETVEEPKEILFSEDSEPQEPFLKRILEKMQAYALEIGIGAAVLAGALIILLT